MVPLLKMWQKPAYDQGKCCRKCSSKEPKMRPLNKDTIATAKKLFQLNTVKCTQKLTCSITRETTVSGARTVCVCKCASVICTCDIF